MRARPEASRWLVLALLFVCRIGVGLQFQTVGSVAGQLVSDFSFTHTQVGTLVGMFMLPGVVMALPSGYAGRFLPDRVLVSLALLAIAAGGFTASAAGGFDVLAAGRMLCGVGFVLGTLYFTKMVADWFADKELATAMAILVVTWPFGIAMGQIGYPALITTHGWRAPFGVAAAYCVVGAGLVFLGYRSPAQHSHKESRASLGLPPRELALTLIASFAWALFNAGYVVYLSFAPQVLVARGYTGAHAAAIISLSSWAMIPAIPLCGYIADRTGKRDSVLYACLLTAIGALLLLRTTSLPALPSLAFGLVGMAPAGVIMALTVESMAPQRRAFGMGVFLSTYFVVVAVAPAAAGWLYDHSGDASWTILFAAALIGLVALANLGFRVVQRCLPEGTA